MLSDPTGSGLAALLRQRTNAGAITVGPAPSTLATAVGLLKEVLEPEVIALSRYNGLRTAPFDPFSVRRVGSCRIEFEFVRTPPGAPDASISSTPSGFVIRISEELRSSGSHSRMRAVAAHELMHTFLYYTSSAPPVRLGPANSTPKEFAAEEDLCRHLARCFLVPADSLSALLGKVPSLRRPTLNGLATICRAFDCSREIAAYRLVRDLSVWSAAFYLVTTERDEARLYFRVKPRDTEFRKLKLPFKSERGETERYPATRTLWESGDSAVSQVIEIAGLRYLIETKRDSSGTGRAAVLIAPIREESLDVVT
jgi:hypothetical protein